MKKRLSQRMARNTPRVRTFMPVSYTHLYATTLHYAPISSGGKFRVAIVLPKETNEPLPFTPGREGEEALLFARNKWLIAHPESGLEKDGAFIGLTGENITL